MVVNTLWPWINDQRHSSDILKQESQPASVASKLDTRHYFCYNAWQTQQALTKSSRFQSNAATFQILRAVNLRGMTRNSVARSLEDSTI